MSARNPFKATAAAVWTVAALCCGAAGGAGAYSDDEYGRVLAARVDGAGRVDYAGLKADRARLDAWMASLDGVDRGDYETWSENEKLAFWINAYNGLTLGLIADHYPIRSSRLKSLIYPANSIRQIPGAWTEKRFGVMGESLTLDAIEHEILRTSFDEPRIHMALVCAAVSCPALRDEPYAARSLDQQLEEQTRRFLADPSKFRVDRDSGVVWLSPIFDWFAGDFVARYGSGDPPGRRSEQTQAVLNFIARYLEGPDRDYVVEGGFRVRYLDYDWTLNEQP